MNLTLIKIHIGGSMNTGIVYKIVNDVNDKVYIGVT